MLRALYEILLPAEEMMELRQAVIPSFIIVSVGKYTMPWIIDIPISALLLTNLKAAQKGHVILKNISANMLLPCTPHIIMINDSASNDSSDGMLKKKGKNCFDCHAVFSIRFPTTTTKLMDFDLLNCMHLFCIHNVPSNRSQNFEIENEFFFLLQINTI